MTPPPTAVLAIGLDAVSHSLLHRWMDDGSLPNLRRLHDVGISSRIGGVEGFFVGSTWPSLYTGRSPAGHGVHYQVQIKPRSYELEWVTRSAFVRSEPLWMVLDSSGRRVAALDVPLSRPGSLKNGVQIVEWGGHDAMFGFHASPTTVGDELKQRFGLHPGGTSCDGRSGSLEDYRGFLAHLKEGVRKKTEWSLELLARGEWDLFMQVFTEAHCTGHQCWHIHDPRHPAHDPVLADALGDPIQEVYQAIDSAVGRLVDAARGARIIVFSAHDMSFCYGAQFLLPTILQRLGVWHPSLPEPGPMDRLRRLAEPIRSACPPFIKAPLRRIVSSARPARQSRGPTFGLIDGNVGLSSCFPLRNGQAVGGIRLNVRGREPAGILEPGDTTDEFCDLLVRDLQAIVDERTGGPLIRRVLRTRDHYVGPYLDRLPDLLVEWSDAVPTGSAALAGGAGARIRASSPKIGEIEGTNEYGRTGEHRAGGWFVATGPSLSHSTLPYVPQIYDVAPTITALLGVAMSGADGTPIPALLH